MKKILVGISGASGAQIAIRLLKRLREMADVETHLIMTKGAELSEIHRGRCRCGSLQRRHECGS